GGRVDRHRYSHQGRRDTVQEQPSHPRPGGREPAAMSCCAAGTESAAELEALKSEAPSAEEMWLSSRVLGSGLRQVDLVVPGVHCGACIALLERELPKTRGVDHARVNLSTRRVSVVFD